MRLKSKREIIIEFQGGHGNQLFQFCAGVYVARQLDRKLLIDDSALRRHPNTEKRNGITGLESAFYSHLGIRKIGKFNSELIRYLDQFSGAKSKIINNESLIRKDRKSHV